MEKSQQLWKNIAVGFFLSAIMLTPLFFWPSSSQSFDIPKTLLFRTLTLLGALSTLTYLMETKEDSSSKINNTITKILFAFTILVMVSTFMSQGRLQAIFGTLERGQGLIQWLYYFTFFLCVSITFDKKIVYSTLNILILTNFLIATYGILQKFQIDPFFQNFATDLFMGRIFSTLGNPDFLGQYLSLGIPIVIAFFIINKNTHIKTYLFLAFLISLTAIFLSGSRAPVVGLLGSSGILCLKFFLNAEKSKKLKTLKISGSILIALITVATLILSYSSLLDRFKPTTENLRSISSRFNIWSSSMEMIKDHPLLGVGPENFQNRFLEYVDPKFYEIELDMNIGADRTHNDILEIASTNGLPAMFLWLSLFIYLLIKYLKNTKGDYILNSLYLVTFTYFIQNFFSFSTTAHYIILFFVLASILHLKNKETPNYKKPKTNFLKISTLTALIISPFIWYHTVYLIGKAEIIYNQALIVEANSGLADAKELFIRAANTYPYFTTYQYALIMRYSDLIEKTLPEIRKTEGITMDNLGWEAVETSKKSFEKAEPLFLKIIDLNPEYPAGNRILADAHFRKKDYKNAAIWYENFLKLSPPFINWCEEIETKNDWEKFQFRIFLKNTSDFENSISNLKKSYENTNNQKDAKEYDSIIKCIKNYRKIKNI